MNSQMKQGQLFFFVLTPETVVAVRPMVCVGILA